MVSEYAYDVDDVYDVYVQANIYTHNKQIPMFQACMSL